MYHKTIIIMWLFMCSGINAQFEANEDKYNIYAINL